MDTSLDWSGGREHIPVWPAERESRWFERSPFSLGRGRPADGGGGVGGGAYAVAHGLPGPGAMRYLISYIRVSNLLLLALAGGVAFLTFVAVGRVFPGEYIPESPDADEPYPFSLTPEFPVDSAEDEAALRAAVKAFLTDTEWSETYKGSEDWDFRDVAVLTIIGGRVGVYGEVVLPAPESRDGPLAFTR